MRYKDLSVLEILLNKRVKFEVIYGSPSFVDIFYGEIKEIGSDYVIVEQKYIKSNDQYEEEFVTQRRKLKNGHFDISKER